LLPVSDSHPCVAMLSDILKVHGLGCDIHQTVALDNLRRPESIPIDELER
jgi:hypothetical protein